MSTLLEIDKLSTYFKSEHGEARAVDNVTLSIDKGEMLGLIGESGSGKTTLALSILNLIDHPGEIKNGTIRLNGKDILNLSVSELEKIRWKDISIIPQSSMNALNPSHTIGNQIIEAIIVHEKITKQLAKERMLRLLELVGIEKSRYKNYPHEFSGGMKQRVAIAMALACKPQLVISDEATTGLDVLTQAQVIALIKKLQNELGLSFLIISHNLPMVTSICDKVAIMYAGKIVEWGPTNVIAKTPSHPYVKALLMASPNLFNLHKELTPIEGSVPNLVNPPTGCRYHPRCPFVLKQCIQEEPILKANKDGHYIACFLERKEDER